MYQFDYNKVMIAEYVASGGKLEKVIPIMRKAALFDFDSVPITEFEQVAFSFFYGMQLKMDPSLDVASQILSQVDLGDDIGE